MTYTYNFTNMQWETEPPPGLKKDDNPNRDSRLRRKGDRYQNDKKEWLGDFTRE